MTTILDSSFGRVAKQHVRAKCKIKKTTKKKTT